MGEERKGNLQRVDMSAGVQPLPAARALRLTPRTEVDAVAELAALRSSGIARDPPAWPSATQLAIAKQEESQAKALTAASALVVTQTPPHHYRLHYTGTPQQAAGSPVIAARAGPTLTARLLSAAQLPTEPGSVVQVRFHHHLFSPFSRSISKPFLYF